MTFTRRFAFAGVACALLATALAGSRALAEETAATKHGPLPWVESLDKAKQTAAKQKKVVFVDFYAEWCGPCKEMLKTTYKDKQVVTRAKNFVPVLINVDKQDKLAHKLGVEALPTIVFFDAKGKEVLRHVGYASKEQFLQMMDEATKKAKL